TPWPGRAGRARAIVRVSDERAWGFLSMVIAGAAQIGVIEQRGLTAVLRDGFVVLLCEERGDALAGETADLEGAGRHRFGSIRIDAAIELQNAEAGAKALLGMRAAGENRSDQPFRA